MYTAYRDLTFLNDETETLMKNTQLIRDRLIYKWMSNNTIGEFPKSYEQFERVLPQFQQYTSKIPMLCFIFADRPSYGNSETECWLVTNNMIRHCFTMQQAYRMLYETDVVIHKSSLSSMHNDRC